MRPRETRRGRSSVAIVGCAVVAAAILATGPIRADAALTSEGCLAKKLKESGILRKCQAIENGKALQGRPADLGKCQTKFILKLAKLNQLATAAGVSCRYRDNDDYTVTDYDTELMWEKKDSDEGVAWLPNMHDVDNRYTWSANPPARDGTVFTDFLARLNDCRDEFEVDGTMGLRGGFAGYCDWRLQTLLELTGILDPFPLPPAILGPNSDQYWLGSRLDLQNATVPPAGDPLVFDFFLGGIVSPTPGSFSMGARAVRGGRPSAHGPLTCPAGSRWSGTYGGGFGNLTVTVAPTGGTWTGITTGLIVSNDFTGEIAVFAATGIAYLTGDGTASSMPVHVSGVLHCYDGVASGDFSSGLGSGTWDAARDR